MFFFKKLFPYIFSLIIFSFTSLFFITLSMVFISYLYKKIGDSFSWESGFNSWNPFYYIEPLFFLFFLLTGLLIGFKYPPFIFMWDPGYKGFFQRVAYFLFPVLFHLFISIVILFLGIFFYKINFLFCSFHTCSLIPDIDSKALFFVMNFMKLKGISLIFIMCLLYTIRFNLYLAMLNLFFSIINYLIQYSVLGNGYKQKIFLVVAFLIFIFLFGSYINNFLWKFISFPAILFFL